MALITPQNFRPLTKASNRAPSPVASTYTIFSIGGETYFQIETYGSPTREAAGTANQNIQLDKKMAEVLIAKLQETFDLKPAGFMDKLNRTFASKPEPVEAPAPKKPEINYVARAKDTLLEAQFSEWLVKNDVKSISAYCRGIKRILRERENGMSWQDLANNIEDITPKYCKGGSEEAFGCEDAGTPRAAIKKFRLFVRMNPTEKA